MELILSWGWLAIAAWLIWRAFRQRDVFQPLALRPPPAADAAPRVAIVLPARDEAQNIGPCLESLAKQDYPVARMRVLVVDDHSEDETHAIAARFGRTHANVSVLRSPALPPRWIGKSHACWIGVRSMSGEADWLCFLDADVRAAPALLSSAVAAAQSEGLDLLSVAPRQELASVAERLIIPCGLYIVSFAQNLRKVQADESGDATATGQFMLVRASAYEACGGHAAISRAICEDMELARLLKRNGGKVVLRGGKELISTRMYTGWRTLWPGFAKNLIDLFGGAAPTIAIALAAIVLAWAAWIIPIADAAVCFRAGASTACAALVPALVGTAAIVGFHVAGACYFRIPFWYGFLFPLGYTAGAFIAFDSVRRRLHGRVTWKGRTYP